jgi:hypothetical protein
MYLRMYARKNTGMATPSNDPTIVTLSSQVPYRRAA